MRYTHTYAEVAIPLKFSNELLPEKQSKRSLDSWKSTSHGWVHSPVFNEAQALAEAFSILGALSASTPLDSLVSHEGYSNATASPSLQHAHTYTPKVIL